MSMNRFLVAAALAVAIGVPIISFLPLTPAALRGKVVLVDFCINWRRTLPYIRAWAAKYRDEGLVVIGVDAPEFSVEKRSSAMFAGL